MARRIFCHQREAVERLFGTTGQDAQAGIKRMRSASNAGLVWIRYLDVWGDGVPPDIPRSAVSRDALMTFAKDFSERGKLPGATPLRLLNAVHSRQVRALERLRGAGATLQAALETRFATGLGGPHPTDIGFTFDRSVGVPYLPGSSVKGIARAAARLLEDPGKDALFGPEETGASAKAWAGDVVFLDAYPVAWPRLEVDVINCHHPAYYGGKAGYPAETEDPVPVYFLTVADRTTFAFRVLSRSGAEERAARAVELLRFGLSELGAGAKTAVGYGAFTG
ncbi:hypothetical protein BE04_20325 [Sorangium cellulosum]|uniref:CRISPR type III-associated protein domain-containing protein n=1 Tax=Sorangium cellulosum TaxID=56 RepID=A0A150PQU9_SORCE|nr:hypothetical protein BE04_20325 [Sorangium cellulosum]